MDESTTQPAEQPKEEFEHTEEPVLDLSSLAPERPKVRFDGKLYELALLQDFGIEEAQTLTRDGNEFDKLWGTEEELTKTDKQRLKQLLDRMFEKVFIAEPEVKVKVRDDQRRQIVVAFTLAPLAAAAAREREKQEAREKKEASTTAS